MHLAERRSTNIFKVYFPIYRYQCCPLYEIEFKRPVLESQTLNDFKFSAQNLPPFAWLPDDPNYAVQVNKECKNWPFYADDLFKKMGALPLKHYEHIDSEMASLTDTNTEQMSTDKKLATLFTFGFSDLERNKAMLSKFNNDLYQTLNFLLDDDNFPASMEQNNQHSTTSPVETQPFSSVVVPANTQSAIKKLPSVSTIDIASTSNSSTSGISTQLPVEITDFLLEFDKSKLKSTTPTPSEIDECSICYNEYESFVTAPELWEKLKCGHKLCSACYLNILTTRRTMSGVEQTFMKCPFCSDFTGTQIGTCPDIQMNVTIIPKSCEGYEATDTISINYFIVSGYQLNRTAYLPNNFEGEEVLKLLKTAWDRRLCFTIGESVTTGQQNVLVWGIHHKTSMSGGVSSYGYPDMGYLDRVKLELKSYGIQ